MCVLEPKGLAFGPELDAALMELDVGDVKQVIVGVSSNAKPIANPQNTLAEYALNQYNNLDFFDISLVGGFNVPIWTLAPRLMGAPRESDVPYGQCPNQLRAQGGCNNPCTVFRTDQYCCNSGSCGPTDLSRFFKDRCLSAYSYPKDDPTSSFTCPGGTNYRVVFCP